MSTTTLTCTEPPFAVAVQPDIGYHPDEAKWKERTARRLSEDPSLPNTPLPDGFPSQVLGPIVWEGKDWECEDQWVYTLSEEQLREIDFGLNHFKGKLDSIYDRCCLDLAMGFVGKNTFPLPTLSTVLQDLARELYSGRGFFVLRTIPIEKYTREELFIIYAGISSHVGTARGRDKTLQASSWRTSKTSPSAMHKRRAGSATPRIPATSRSFIPTSGTSLHSETAAEGGTSRISSGGRIYNELAATRPDLIKTLSEPWPLDSFGGTPSYTTRPLLYHVAVNGESKVVFQYSRRHFTGYGPQKRNPDIPPITEAQAEALDAIHFLAEKYTLGLNFQKGDIQYINSLGLLHARDGFRDSPDKA
ncbi:taurine catabolism dioxygenase TauD [Coprinopsis cinerea okayama7|uniref:Taurine catabolism dioxygenase TauD n=1 Tax=Coprinopsis cinerea (strain Okayama-7 / 130 / ATCC MYA-4618 / FGSC 9003) TaxID=240176 RepID=A8NAU0_COPC7|nr:taurine catabolism dioxygenase TauD [Coprinopsis cinerea okayama7\|eukprot:XP_001831942.2 taurine catabolism dioxygenase TauD [Coprinopsis cinerea okayama7\